MLPEALARGAQVGIGRRSRAAVLSRLPANVDAHTQEAPAALLRWLGAFAAALVLVGLTNVWLSAQVLRYEYDRIALHAVLQRLQHEQHDLDAKLELLQRPDWIERVARDELGMTRPQPGQVQELP